jgi:hypothetical protein
MARRMFSTKITSSARFLRMSHEAQNLYFHLSMNADDDGVVEAFSVMRLAAVGEDALNELVEKKFVRILNDDLVAHILDWDENNKIRSDRKRDSIYKELLEQSEAETADNAQPLEPAPTLDCSGSPTNDGQLPADCGQVTADCGQLPAECPHRIGEDRLGKDILSLANARESLAPSQPMQKSADESEASGESEYVPQKAREKPHGGEEPHGQIRAPVPYAAIMDAYNTICTSLTAIKTMNDKRKQAVKTRFLQDFHGDMREVQAFFRKVAASDFLCGRNERSWTANFDWLMKSSNAVKVLEGNYDNRRPKGAVADGTGEGDHSADVSADETPWIQQLREWEERKRNSPRPWDVQPAAGGDRDAPGGDHPDRGRAG